MRTERGVDVRRPEDAQRAAVALAILLVTCWMAEHGVSAAEQWVFEEIYRLPDVLEPLLWLPMQLGSLVSTIVVAIAAWLVWRDWRPAVGALAAGVASWQLAKVVKAIIDRDRPHSELVDLVHRRGTPTEGLGFVSGHSAVAFALAAVVSPYLPRRWRWGAYGVAGVVGLARIHVGAHFPLDVVGGAALGSAAGLMWRFAVGSPGPSRWSPIDRARPARAVDGAR